MTTTRESRASRPTAHRTAHRVRHAPPRISAASRAALAEANEIIAAIDGGTRKPQSLESFLAEVAAL